jgi:hypothetical protein
LSGLVKKIQREASVFACNGPEDLAEIQAHVHA